MSSNIQIFIIPKIIYNSSSRKVGLPISASGSSSKAVVRSSRSSSRTVCCCCCRLQIMNTTAVVSTARRVVEECYCCCCCCMYCCCCSNTATYYIHTKTQSISYYAHTYHHVCVCSRSIMFVWLIDSRFLEFDCL